VHPEVVALGIGVGNVRKTNPLHFIQQGAVSQDGPAQFSPIPPLTTGNYVVDSGESEVLMIEVAMKHDNHTPFLFVDIDILRGQ
jgi:hypothetical protein